MLQDIAGRHPRRMAEAIEDSGILDRGRLWVVL